MKLLEGDLTHARKVLSRTLQSPSYSNSEHQAAIARDQALVDNIEEKLLAVVQSRRTDA
jgi:hypothetical protein